MISIDEDFLKAIDERRKTEQMSRSGYIVYCINKDMKKYNNVNMLNDVTNALNILDTYKDDLDSSTKDAISNLLLEKGNAFK